jgi:hypothetical protein
MGNAIKTIERCFPQNNPHPCSSMTEGGGWGEEFRHNRAINSGRPRRLERIEITQQKIILFLFDLKFRRAHIKINKENFFAGWQSIIKWSATAGMTSLFRILFKKCSNFVQKTPPNCTFCKIIRFCLGTPCLVMIFFAYNPSIFEFARQRAVGDTKVPAMYRRKNNIVRTNLFVFIQILMDEKLSILWTT